MLNGCVSSLKGALFQCLSCPLQAPAVIDTRRPPHNWPADGHVKFDRYSTRYRPGLDLVLKDISVDISGGTKVREGGRYST